MKLESLKQRIDDLETVAHAGWIPSTDANGNRAWIKGRGCGIKFMREILHLSRSTGHTPTRAELPEDLKEQVDLWSRAEVDGPEYGDIARSNREMARDVLGLEHGAHL